MSQTLTESILILLGRVGTRLNKAVDSKTKREIQASLDLLKCYYAWLTEPDVEKSLQKFEKAKREEIEIDYRLFFTLMETTPREAISEVIMSSIQDLSVFISNNIAIERK